MKTILVIIFSVLVLSRLVHAQNFDNEKIRSEMKAFLLSYGQAVEQMDVQKTMDHFSDEPEFLVVADGKTYDSEQMKSMIRNQFYQGLKKVKIEWDTMNIKVLNSNQAVAYFKITQSLVDTNERTLKVAVEATFIGSKKDKQFKIIYGQANHKMINGN